MRDFIASPIFQGFISIITLILTTVAPELFPSIYAKIGLIVSVFVLVYLVPIWISRVSRENLSNLVRNKIFQFSFGAVLIFALGAALGLVLAPVLGKSPHAPKDSGGTQPRQEIQKPVETRPEQPTTLPTPSPTPAVSRDVSAWDKPYCPQLDDDVNKSVLAVPFEKSICLQEKKILPKELKLFATWNRYKKGNYSVRDHRIAIRDRRRSWRLASLAPLAFSSGPGFISPL